MSRFKKLTKKQKAIYMVTVALYPMLMLFAQLGKMCKLFDTKKRQILASTIVMCVIIGVIPFSLIAKASSSNPSFINGYYQLKNKDDLIWFANIVNGGNFNCNAKLTANIMFNDTSADKTTWKEWTPICGKKSIKGYTATTTSYTGKFDGQNHVISGLYISASTSNQGFFGKISGNAIISNLGIKDSYFYSNGNIGAITGINDATITDCFNENSTVYATVKNFGGICGSNNSNGKIENCYNTGYINKGNSQPQSTNGGGIAGISSGSIKNCYSSGKVQGSSDIGGITSSGTVDNSYYINNNTAYNNIGTVISKTVLTDGTLCYLLNGDQSEYHFYQNIDVGTLDDHPILTDTHSKVLKIKSTNIIYTNYSEPSKQTIDGKSYYQISTVQDLSWFSNAVRAGLNSINAQLCNDIYVNSSVLKSDGDLNGTPNIKFTSIGMSPSGDGTTGVSYCGTFDGQGHTIYGLYSNLYLSYCKIGLFYDVGDTGYVKNVTVSDSYFALKGRCSHSEIGGIAGNNAGTIENCSFNGTLYSDYNAKAYNYSGNIGGIAGINEGVIDKCNSSGKINTSGDPSRYGGVGGIVGCNYGTVKNSYNTGSITSSHYVGGICGRGIDDSIVEYCYNIGNLTSVNSSDQNLSIGGIVGQGRVITVRKCFNTGAITANYGIKNGIFCSVYFDNNNPISCYFLEQSGLEEVYDGEKAKSSSQFKSGEVCYLLNDSKSIGTETEPLRFYQTIDNKYSADPIPVLDNTRGIVYKNATTYNNVKINEDPSVTFNPPINTAYDGNSKQATFTKNNNCGNITVKYYNQSGAPVTNPTNVGTYMVKIDVAANDNYKAATDLTDASWTFTITAKALTKSNLTVTGIGDEIYTGHQIKHIPTVRYNGKTLVKDTDYFLTYGTNTGIGTGSVTINFKGNYSGSVTYNFNIDYGKATTDMYDLPATDYNGWYNSVKTIRAKSGYQIGVFTDYFYSDIDIPDEGENCSQEFYLKATDGKIYKETISYNMDYQKPNVDITVKENSIKKFINAISFGVLCKNTADVKIVATDDESAVAKTEYQVVDKESDYDENGEWTNGNSFSLRANKICYIYARATDKAGNQTIESSKKLAIATDSEAYDQSVTFIKNSTQNISAKVKLNGNTINKIMIDENYIVQDEYIISDENPDTIILKASYLNTLTNGTHNVKVYYNPLGDSNLCTSSDSEEIDGSIATTYFELIVTNRVLTKDDFTYTAPSELTYNGSKKTATVKYKSITDGSEIAVEYWQNNSKLASAPKDAGTYTVKVSTTKTDNYADAKSISIGTFTIKKAEQNKPQSVSAINTTTLQNNDGKITGVAAGMEFKKSGDSSWKAIVDDSVTGLSNGIYLVRYSENENYNASESTQVTIEKFAGNKENTPSATFDATIKALTGIVSGQKYCIDGGAWKTIKSNLSSEITKACRIEIYMPGDKVHTLDSDIQKITVTKATAPIIGKTDETIKNKADGTITGITSSLEQKINGDWSSDLKTENLPVGKYEFRVRANGTVLESDTVTVTISEGKMLSVTTPTAKEYTINSTDSKSIAYNGSYSFSISVKGGYSYENMVVKANNTTINPVNGTYTVNNITTDTSITVSGIADTTLPTAEIEISENKFNQLLNSITFGLFFKETQTVSVKAEDKDGSGVDKTYYYLANAKTNDFTDVSWTEFEGSFNISPNNKYVVYVKVTDKSGNERIINSDGIVLDNIVPQISAENGKTYCEEVEVTVTDNNLDSVTLDGNPIILANNKFSVSSKSGEQTIVATDKSGNSTTVTITVNDGHTWDDGVVTTEPTAAKEGVKTYTCTICGATKTESIPKLAPTMIDGENGQFTQGSKDGLTFRSDAALADLVSVAVDGNVISADKYTTAEGSTIITLTADYLATLSVGKHTLDIKSVSGTASTNFLIEESADNTINSTATNSPKTGDNNNMVLWICLLFISGGALITFVITKKSKKNNSK